MAKWKEAEIILNKITLHSPNGKFRVELQLTDNAELKPQFYVKEGGEWKHVQGADNSIARWAPQRSGWTRI